MINQSVGISTYYQHNLFVNQHFYWTNLHKCIQYTKGCSLALRVLCCYDQELTLVQ